MLWLAAIPIAALGSWAGWRWFRGEDIVPDNILSFDLGGDPVQSWAKRNDIDPKLLQATIAVESGGDAMVDGRPVIRFETHIFSGRRLPKSKRAKARLYFRFGKPVWKQQAFKRSTGEWVPLHGRNTMQAAQDLEYEALTIAAQIDPQTAYQSISMGVGQLMGFHYARLGYASPKAMFDDAARGERSQLKQFLRFVGTDPKMVAALQRGDLKAFATIYNGPGQADNYARLIRAKLDSGALT